MNQEKQETKIRQTMEYDQKQVKALGEIMSNHYENIKEKVDIREIMESSDSDNENEQAFR